MADDSRNYDAEFPAIYDVVSGSHELIALLVGSSMEDTYTAMAFQVTQSVRRIERVRDATTVNANGGTTEFGLFGENGFSPDVPGDPGNEVFSIDAERDKTIVEYGFAVEQDGIYTALKAGDGANVIGKRSGATDYRGWSAENARVRGGVLSDHTEMESPATSTNFPIPTTALSPEPHNQGVVRVDSRENGDNPFRFAFRNDTGSDETIDLTAMGQAYNVRVIEDENTVRDIIRGDGYDRRLLTWGHFDNTNPNLPAPWIDNRVTVGPGDLTPGVGGQ